MARKKEPPNGGELVFCRSFRHWRSGKTIYAKPGEVFCFVARKSAA
jgi:hypothetical protein